MSLDNPTRYLGTFDATDDDLDSQLAAVLEHSQIQGDIHNNILKVLRGGSIMQPPDGFSIARESDTMIRLYQARVEDPASQGKKSPAETRGFWAISTRTGTK